MRGTDKLRVDPDGWTLRSADGSRTAHSEHTIAVTESEPIVLTQRPTVSRPWTALERLGSHRLPASSHAGIDGAGSASFAQGEVAQTTEMKGGGVVGRGPDEQAVHDASEGCLVVLVEAGEDLEQDVGASAFDAAGGVSPAEVSSGLTVRASGPGARRRGRPR